MTIVSEGDVSKLYEDEKWFYFYVPGSPRVMCKRLVFGVSERADSFNDRKLRMKNPWLEHGTD